MNGTKNGNVYVVGCFLPGAIGANLGITSSVH